MCLLWGCGPEDPAPEQAWSCTPPRDGWERCDGTSIIWCHAVSHANFEDGHFHEGTNCDAKGLSCIELDEQTAACSDTQAACDEGYAACDERVALNCVDGATASKRCSLTTSCQVTDQGARCIPLEQE